jgi:hypothetical protein
MRRRKKRKSGKGTLPAITIIAAARKKRDAPPGITVRRTGRNGKKRNGNALLAILRETRKKRNERIASGNTTGIELKRNGFALAEAIETE